MRGFMPHGKACPVKSNGSNPDGKENPVNNTIVQRNVPVPLTRDDKITYGKQLADLWQNYHDIEGEKKTANAEFKERLDELEGRIAYMARVLANGEEWRAVDCTWQYDFASNAKMLVRMDTGAVIDTQAISAEERQWMLQPDPAVDLPETGRI